MLWVPVLLTGAVVTLVLSTRKKESTLFNRGSLPPIEDWPIVSDGTIEWRVAPDYLAPVGIGEAAALAQELGTELPTPALVDAIWKAADLKLEPQPRGALSHPPSDFTAKTMNSPEAIADQAAIIQRQVLEQRSDGNFQLLAGSHKDVVVKDGKLGIYGWHHLNGKVIQGFFAGHSTTDPPGIGWKDYSQGLRLVRRA